MDFPFGARGVDPRMGRLDAQMCDSILASCESLYHPARIQSSLYDMLLVWLGWRRPTFAACSIMWDETQERLRCGGLPQEIADVPSTAPWHIFVTRMSFIWGWKGETPSQWQAARFEVVCPPMIVPTPSAEALWVAMMRNSTIQPLFQFRRRLLALAQWALEFKESDGASGNHKLVAHWVRSGIDPPIVSWSVLCRNHRLHIGLTHTLSIISWSLGDPLKMMNDMYAAVLYLKMGSHFLQLASSCFRAVERHFRVLRGAPPSWVQDRNAQLKDYMLTNYPVGRAMASTKYDFPRQGLIQYEADLTEYFAVFNAEHFGHHYDQDALVDDRAIKSRMVRSLLKVPLRGHPQTPNEGKWTKVGPCTDFFVFGEVTGSLPALTTVSFARDRHDKQPPQAAGPPGEMSWHATAGARLRRFLDMVQCERGSFCRL
jgi:hypothetical protein